MMNTILMTMRPVEEIPEGWAMPLILGAWLIFAAIVLWEIRVKEIAQDFFAQRRHVRRERNKLRNSI